MSEQSTAWMPDFQDLVKQIMAFDIETDDIVRKNPAGGTNIDQLGMTVCVVKRYPGEVVKFVMGAGTAEDARTLEALGAMLDAAPLLCAFNGRGFDLRVLARYYARDRVAAWACRLVDPFEAICDSTGTGTWVKLDEMLEANGHAPKTGTGVQAVEWWAAGERDRVVEYCAADVDALYALVTSSGTLRYPQKRWNRTLRRNACVPGAISLELDWAAVLQQAAGLLQGTPYAVGNHHRTT